jgi:hypothetical protein
LMLNNKQQLASDQATSNNHETLVYDFIYSK